MSEDQRWALTVVVVGVFCYMVGAIVGYYFGLGS